MMKVIKVKNYEEMSMEGFQYVLKAVQTNQSPVLGLATGTTPMGVYQAMIRDHEQNHTSYEHVRTINLDEYVGIEKTHQQSYATFMNEHLFKFLNINEQNCYIPRGMKENKEAECLRYNDIIKMNPIDVQLLGIGGNGHIGFNEPGTALNSLTHVVTLDECTRLDNARFFTSLDEVPKYAVTMGIQSIMKAKQIVLLASGKSKAAAVAQMIKGDVSPNCPATVLQLHPNVVIIADEEALSELAL